MRQRLLLAEEDAEYPLAWTDASGADVLLEWDEDGDFIGAPARRSVSKQSESRSIVGSAPARKVAVDQETRSMVSDPSDRRDGGEGQS